MEKKQLSGGFELRSVSEDGTFSGHGSVFGVKDHYGDVVEPGAFSASLADWQKKGRLPKLLLQHDPRQIIGKWTAMREDARGLYVEGKLFTQLAIAKTAHTLMKEGELDGLSIGFSVPEGGMTFDRAENVNRIKAVDLWEVSVVTFPANPAAQVEAVKAALGNPREFERQLRDVLGLTQSEAKKLMAEGFKAVAPRDVSDEGPAVDPHSPAMQQLLELAAAGVLTLQTMRY